VKRACLVVCVSVCLSVGEHISGKKHPLFIILCSLPVVVAQSSSGGVEPATPYLRIRPGISDERKRLLKVTQQWATWV